MHEFRGRRLAVYDDLARGGAVEWRDPNVQNALGWLAYHHLVWRNGEGRLQARAGDEAQALWQRGAAKDAEQLVTACLATPAECAPVEPVRTAPEMERPRVHTRQVEFFANV